MSVPIYFGSEACGFIQNSRQGLHTKFYGEVETKELCRVYGIYESGELLLGVPVPEHGKMILRASLPSVKLPSGRFLRGEARTGNDGWTYFPGGTISGVCYPEGQRKGAVLRFPWKPGEPLPVEEMLLFYWLMEDNGRTWICLSTDNNRKKKAEITGE